ncbi:MAG: tRNA epoxyqueuosine(34) reductase QueG [Firmicutes bacterium]|nr:tRNA epoxyqueuosine(34) reductase QueG [Bacillota bacterium]
MKKELIEFCKANNIEYVGIANLGPYEDFGDVWKKQIEKGHLTGFEEKEFEKRINPTLTMSNIKSIIVCLFPYYVGTFEEANLSKYVYSTDYHIIIKKKLEIIGQYLKDNLKNFEYKAYIDTGPLSDRYLAYKAGLGFRGINGHIINDKYGSYVFIGYILSNYPFEPDKPDDRTCMKCYKCMDNCLGQCITGDGTINPLKCKSYLTQKKGELKLSEIGILRRNHLVWGCDTCQDVCPHNKNIDKTPIEEFKTNLIYNIDCDEITNISHKDFNKKYGDRSFSWRGKKVLIRNCEVFI